MDNTDLQEYVEHSEVAAKILNMEGRVHSVAAASEELGLPPDRFIKTLVFIGPEEELILAIVQGTDRASSKRISKALDIEPPRLATPEEAIELTGYEVGGTPPVSIPNAKVLIDPNVMAMNEVVGGGGSDRHLLRISPSEIVRVTGGKVVRVRK
ncbi:MAG: YbaK/EbsC family protein [Candidatus Thorarchaeota archaeon]|nr:MAG: YbaK/EbsC family protein [Candidatus Thorarchaeota archaeon]